MVTNVVHNADGLARTPEQGHLHPTVTSHEALHNGHTASDGSSKSLDVGIRSVAVAGLGYVGLPTALMLAAAGFEVTGIDVDPDRVAEVASGHLVRVSEPDVQALIEREDVRRNLRAQTAPSGADCFILAVPTPVDHATKRADLRLLISALRAILPFVKRGNLVIVESTIPPLTCRQVVAPLLREAGFSVFGDTPDVLLAHCPERILPGNIAHELVHNDRVIGGVTPDAAEAARSVYGSFVKGAIHITDDVTAEFCKLIENTFRDVNIALANELAVVAETVGVDVLTAIALANKHPRVRILTPGIGVGGHCIPVDPWFIHQANPENARLIRTAREVNDAMPLRTAAKIVDALGGPSRARGSVVVAAGATYKANTNDTRESPALEVVRALREAGVTVTVYDPVTQEYATGTLAECSRNANAIAVLVAHDVLVQEFDENREQILAGMRQPLVLTF